MQEPDLSGEKNRIHVEFFYHSLRFQTQIIINSILMKCHFTIFNVLLFKKLDLLYILSAL